MNKTDFHITGIALNFQIDGVISEVRNYGNGHINDTFLLKNSAAGAADYLLQRINHHVFKDVPALMENVDRVTTHLQNKLSGSANHRLLRLIHTKEGNTFHRDDAGLYWRLYVFIPGSKSYDAAETAKQAYEAGLAFGSFQLMLSDMDPALLSDTIVDFHNVKKRLKDFHEALQLNKAGRVSAVSEEIDIINCNEQAMSIINKWGQDGLIPQRITHNDTKLNNVLLDADDKAICVIDLDTVMRGYVAYDFGDAIRTIGNAAAEDEPDLEKIQINTELFKAYTEGYIKAAGGFLTEKEVESLSWGILLLPYMQGVRFLTDYLQGDTYYKISYPEHNLVRARAQFRLFSKLNELRPHLQQIITQTIEAQKRILTGINTNYHIIN